MSRLDPTHSLSLGAEPAYCPACDLHHTRRPDWLCPSCGMPVETEAAAQLRGSSKRARGAGEEWDPHEFPGGSVAAGALLAATGLLLAIAYARHPVVEHRWPLVAAMVVLAVLGFELLIKVSPARWVVVAVASLTLVVAAEDRVRARWPDLTRDPLPPAARGALRELMNALSPIQLLLCAALLVGTAVLVVGRPGRVRLAAGVLLAFPLAVVEIVRAFR